MKIMDFQKLEAFEEQVHRARELFVASVHNPYRPEMMEILQAAEKALKTAQKSLGLDDGRSEPQSWWVDWQAGKRSDPRASDFSSL